MSRILSTPLSLDRAVAAVSDEHHGAVATFSGVVRASSHGRRVHRLDYEAYTEMAERTMATILATIERELPSVKLYAEHRTGSLGIGELAVVVAAGAPHRREALLACDRAIEAIKAELPIWKREHTDDGAEWVRCEIHQKSHDR